MRKFFPLTFLLVTLIAPAILASAGESDILNYDFFPYENNLLLDGMPVGGVGSFAVPHRPSLLNPASLATVPQAQAAFDFQRYYWGIGEGISSGNVLYAHRHINSGWGASAGIFAGGLLSTQSLAVHYARRMGKPHSPIEETRRLGLFGGATARFRRRAYAASRFRLGDPNDPLFEGGTSATALSFGAGMIYRKPGWSISIVGDDINRPNLGLAGDDRLPMELQFAGEFTLPWEEIRFSPSINFRSEYGEFEADIDPNLAFRRDFLDGNLELGLFFGRWAFGIGATYYLDANAGLGVRYEASQPLTGVNFPSHRVSASYRFEPPPPAYPDLVVSDIALDGDPVAGRKFTIRIEIGNEGTRPADDVPVAVFLRGERIRSLTAKRVPAGGSATVDFEWTASDSGALEFLVRADDTGELSPNFDGRILELDETNNEQSAGFYIFGAPTASMNVDVRELHVTQYLTVTEDEPLIPIVFFSAGSDEVPERFHGTLRSIARRLADNPEATLTFEGYFSGDDPQNREGRDLADARAANTRDALLSIEPSLDGRVDVAKWHDRARPRAERERFEGTRLGGKFTAEENRRVEIRVSPAQPSEWLLRANTLESLDVESIKARLAANPLFEIVAVAPSLDSAFAIKNKFAEYLGSKFAGRVFSREAHDEEPKIIITAGGILYMPKTTEIPDGAPIVEPGYGRSNFRVSVRGGADVAESRVVIENSRGALVREFTSEGGLIGDVAWDWRTSAGALVEPTDYYIARAEAIDKFGQRAITEPETLRVEHTERRKSSGRLILVQFAFAGAHGEPDYASVRMEQLAREIVDRIDRDGGVDVIIGGHTDVVGVETANEALSRRRADEQLLTFREYIMKILGMSEEDELNAWLTTRNSAIATRGYGSSRPYMLMRGKGTESYEIELGDNELPEGRITNRRVEIEFAPKRE